MKAHIFILSLIIVCISPLSAAPLLPVDIHIGQTVEPESGSVEEMTLQSLGETYSPTWIDAYVGVALRKAFTNTYDTQLATKLPLRDIQIGRSVMRAGLYEVPFCYHEPSYGWGTMVWTKGEDETWALLALSFQSVE